MPVKIDFALVRPLFGGSLSQPQVDGINADLDAWSFYGDGDLRKLAYILATDKHESAGTMQAVRETLATSDASAKARLEKAYKAGKLGSVKTPYWRDGWFGRGKVQLTHEANYLKAQKLTGIPFHDNPGLALDLKNAALVLVRGMMEGWFTGHKLGDYIDGAKADYINARRVVNGTDRAVLIAGYADTFAKALSVGAVAQESPPATPAPSGSSSAPTGLAGFIAAIIKAILAYAATLFHRKT